MLEMKEFVAIQNFSISIDNGKSSIDVKKGESLEFDGLTIVLRGEKGSSRSLSKVIGEWIAPAGKKVETAAPKLASPSRNVTGGRILEHSDYPSDPTIGVSSQPNDSLAELVKNYEKVPETKIVNGKREVTGNMEDIKKEVTIINDDTRVVKIVNDNGNSPIANKNSVELETNDPKPRAVLSHESQVAKETNYSDRIESNSTPKKLQLDYESSGVEVRKTGVNKVAGKELQDPNHVVEDSVEVRETSYPANQNTDVGSSTQAQLAKNRPAKKAPAKKAPAKKGKSKSPEKTPVKSPGKKEPAVTQDEFIDEIVGTYTTVVEPTDTNTKISKSVVVNSDGQEAVVISKVSRDDSLDETTKDGISSKVSIGRASDGGIEMDDVSFSSNNNFEEPGVTFSSGGDTPSEVYADEAQIIPGDDEDLGIDLNNLLSGD